MGLWSKIWTFMRGSKKMGLIFRLLSQCWHDIKGFLLVMLAFDIMFALSCTFFT